MPFACSPRCPASVHRFVLSVAVPLLLLGLAPRSAAQPETGETVTVCRTLGAGVNLVSLPVVPDTPELATLLADVLPALVLIQDENGAHYIPSQDVNELSTWAWDQTYKLVTNASANLCVEGRTIVPESSPIALSEGWNWISYLPTQTYEVAEAFASIESVLERVEGPGSLLYIPGDDSSTLDSLHTGEGYRVWVSDASLLEYPPNGADGGDGGEEDDDGEGDDEEEEEEEEEDDEEEEEEEDDEEEEDGDYDYEVGSLGAALALAGLQVGQDLLMRGYYDPDDFGGGVFDVTDDGATPDGGTVFVPSEHWSAVQTETWRFADRDRYLETLPENHDIVFGSFHVELLYPSSGEVIVAADGRDLHGHEWVSRHAAGSLIDYDTGLFNDQRQRFAQACRDRTGDLWTCDIRATYRYATSDHRLVRRDVGETLNANWFGARPIEDDASFDNQPVLCHLVNIANQQNAEAAGSVTTLLFPETKVYGYFGPVQLGANLTLQGAGGTELATVTNDLGHTYQPVRPKSSRTTLRVMDGEALKHIRMKKSPDDPFYLPPDTKHILKTRKTAIYIANHAETAGLRDIVLDGNWQNNQQAWTEGWASHQEKEANMRNTPGWSGFISTDHGNVHIPQGQHLVLENVQVSGFGATSILGDANNTWTGTNVRLGNALWNHTFYSANGTWTNLTFEGFAWTQAVWAAGDIINLVYEDGAPAPYRSGPDLLSIRGGDVSSQDDADGEPRITQRDGTAIELGTLVDGFYLDLRGSQINIPFKGQGPYLSFENGTIVADEEGFASVFQESGNGNQKALYPDYRIENIEVYDTGSLQNSAITKTMNTTDGLFRNITKQLGPEGADGNGAASFAFHANWRNHYAWETPQVNVFQGIVNNSPAQFLATVNVHENATGVDYFVLDSQFNNTSNTLYRGLDGNGTLESLPQDLSKLRVYLDNVAFRLHDGSFQNLELFWAMTHFSGVTDSESGNTSEDASIYVSGGSDGGRTYVVIPTNLFWAPLSDGGTVSVTDNAGGIVSDVSFSDASGNPLGSDKRGPHLRVDLTRALGASESVSFSWEAAVRPWPDGVSVPDYAQ